MINLERYAGRPTLVAVAAMNAITGLAAAAILAPLSFGRDAEAFRRGAQAIADGGWDRDFLYSPLAGLVARPLTWIPAEAAAVAMALIGVAVLLAGVALETRGREPIDRALVALAALTFAPVVNELLLGQVTLLIAAALYPAVRRPDAFRGGIGLGVVLALAPKPLLAPLLLWMLIRRPRALAAATGAAVMLTLAGFALMGADLYRQWADILTMTGEITRRGNLSLWGAGMQGPALVIGAGVAVAAALAIVREEAAGLVAAMLAGLLLAPYTLLYSASILLLAVRPALAFAPKATRVLALVSNPAFLVAPAGLLGAGFAVAAWRPGRAPAGDA